MLETCLMNLYANLHDMTAISTNAIFPKMDSHLSIIIPCWKLCLMTHTMSKILMVIQVPSLTKNDKDSSYKMQQIKWFNWKGVANPVGEGEHMVKVASFGILTALHKELVEQLPHFIKHAMLKRVQAEAKKASQAKVGGEQGLLQVDSAENYNYV